MATLSCYSCKKHYTESDISRCECGEPLWIDIDGIVAKWPTEGPRSMWRYPSFLPVSEPIGIASAAGGTPLVRTPRLDLGTVNVYVKDETENPTGTFKDRGSAVGVTAAIEQNHTRVGTVSHGNMAISMAAHAAGHDLDCLVFVPEDISNTRLANIGRFDPEIVKVRGPYGELYQKTLELDSEIRFVNSDDPFRVAGQKTVALEICEQFGRTAPDGIILPVSSGGQFSGIWKALDELRTAGLIETIPRLFAVQSDARAPIVRAYNDGATTVEPIVGSETIAYSIGNVDPPSGNRVLEGIEATEGAAVSVTDEELLGAQRDFSRRCGMSVETSSAVVLAGFRRLHRDGTFDDGDDIVLIATGSGFKESPTDEGLRITTVDIDSLATTIE